MTTERLVIAVDGPSGSGKSSTSRGVAKALGLAYLDTGAMYRAVTRAFLDAGVDPADAPAVIAVTVGADLEISTDPDDQWVRVNGRDVTTAIREPEVSANASAVSTVPECRANLVARQRAIIDAAPNGIVAEGRDITTVVAPDASVRVLLTASEEARLRRRSAELHGATDAAAVEATRDQVVRRDRDDSTVSTFTEAAPGVVLVDTSDLDFEQSVAAVLAVVAAETGR